MKTLKTFLIAGMLALVASVAGAQSAGNVFGLQVQPFRARNASDVLTAVSTDVGIYVKYIGTATGAATVAVDAATGDIAFVANGAADATVDPATNCAGGVASSLDVSDADCDTIGEVVDHINASVNWIAVPYGMLRADSSNNTLITLAATSAKGVKGLGLLKDTAVALEMTAVMLPKGSDGAARGLSAFVNNNKLTPNPFGDSDTTLTFASALMTTTDAVTNLITAYCVVPSFNGAKSTTASVTSAETATIIYREAAAATTVTGKVDELAAAGGVTCNGGKLLVRVVGNTTLTVPTLVAAGFQASRFPQ